MSFKKKVAISAAVGGMALAAVPALALENEFHGSITAQYINSNFNGSPATYGSFDPLDPTARKFNGSDGAYRPQLSSSAAPVANFIEQRSRLLYIAKVNNDLKVVSHFELDYSFWGDSSYDVHRNHGGALGADQVNIETKNLYVDANIPNTQVNVKIGMQGNDDAYKGIFTSADMAGILATVPYGKTVNSVGFFRWNDNALQSGEVPGKEKRDFIMFDSKYNLSDSTKIGGSYYIVHSTNNDTTTSIGNFAPEDLLIHMVGLNAATTIGPVTLDGFLVGQFGKDRLTEQKVKAFAGNVGAKMQVGKGTARAEFLYVSGDGNPQDGKSRTSFYTPKVWGSSESGYYNNEMLLLGRDKNAMTTDNAIVYDAQNFDEGVIAGFIGYDMPFTSKFSASANAGFAAVAQSNGSRFNIYDSNGNLATAGTPSSSKYLGTEINAEANYKLMDSWTVGVRGGYAFLGDYFKGRSLDGKTPDNPYDVKFITRVTF